MMDDILIHAAKREQHDERLNMVLEHLQMLGLTLNAEKCQFAQTSVKFLGHIIDGSGIWPDPSKVSPIMKYQPQRMLETYVDFWHGQSAEQVCTSPR